MLERIFNRFYAARLLAAPFMILYLATMSEPAVADTDATVFAGCYLLELSPIESGSGAETFLPKEFELRLEGEKKSSGQYSLIPSTISVNGRNLPGSWMVREEWLRIRWGDGYAFVQADLKREGEVLKGRAGTWSDDGGFDKWTNTAVATRTRCITRAQSKGSEIIIQTVPAASESQPHSSSKTK